MLFHQIQLMVCAALAKKYAAEAAVETLLPAKPDAGGREVAG
jgi:predicted Na+-dependent transporter